MQINDSVINSHRYDYEDEKLKYLMRKISEIDQIFMLLLIPEFFPIVNYILPKPILNYLIGNYIYSLSLNDVKLFLCMQPEILEITLKVLKKPFVDNHLKTLDPNNPRDLMDDYLIEMKEKKCEDYSHFNITGEEEEMWKKINVAKQYLKRCSLN
ncbi:hypothetical protein Anas_05866 [Armadillidium nasatum]|uniref:Uncharacterized protein n=1 Tax=Armadillidium nasatum TaxID=96803 RepID=A0A5N5SQY7_9CRUS|nr:hypothetical protein Anas_05866 [Armadillidium nasatum]